ncbi:hypothetical protein HK098_007235 [Nowakowskiella sp. JEL0407]|nr:hypothetical protein HK098_007235 [Nowakowskiella sp. JEL0407]
MGEDTSYVVEYSRSGRARCKAGKSCSKTIEKGEIRVGTSYLMNGKPSTSWRHVGCLTKKLLTNIGDSANLNGMDTLKDEDKERIIEIFANKDTMEEPKKAPAKRGKKADADDGEEKPKKTRTRGRKKKATVEEEKEMEAEEAEEEEE